MKIKKGNKLLVLGVVIIIILAIIAFATGRKKGKLNYDKMTDEEVAIAMQEKIDYINKIDLSQMGERDRMEYYVSSFVKAVENKQYEEAYEMLYDDFKKNFFPTLSSFEEYAQSKFPKIISLDHSNIERSGDVYVLWVTLNNPLASKDQGIEMNFVVQENDLNDFVISFTVI